jgi:hypothetical protein
VVEPYSITRWSMSMSLVVDETGSAQKEFHHKNQGVS